MTFLFDDETIREIHDYNVAKEARQEGLQQGMQRGMQQGMQQGREEGIGAMVSTLSRLSVDRDVVIQSLVREFSLLPQVAEEKVSKYWAQ